MLRKDKLEVKNEEKESVFTYYNIKIEERLSTPLWIFGLAAFGLFVYLNIINKDNVRWQYVLGACLAGVLFLYEFHIFTLYISRRARRVGDFAATLTHDELIYVNRNDASQEMHHIKIEDILEITIDNVNKDIYGDILVKLKDSNEPVILHNVYKPNEVVEVYKEFLTRIK